MGLRADLLQFLVQLPEVDSVEKRKELIATTGLTDIVRFLDLRGSNAEFFTRLLNELSRQGQGTLLLFLPTLRDAPQMELAGLESRKRLAELLHTIQNLDRANWKIEFESSPTHPRRPSLGLASGGGASTTSQGTTQPSIDRGLGSITPRTSPKPKRRRVVNTGFAAHGSPSRPIKQNMALQTSRSYYFWLEIGKPLKGSIEDTPTDIPEVPQGAHLTVALFGFQGEIEISHGADIGELEVKPDGSVVVARQPAGNPPPSRRLRKRLFFPIHTPSRSGAYRMRCNIYWGQILLQSRLITAHVKARPKETAQGEKMLHSTLDYTLSNRLDPARLVRLAPHQLSILLNDNGDGTHSFFFFSLSGEKKWEKNNIRFGEGELESLIEEGRRTLRIASWGEDGEWREGLEYLYRDKIQDRQRSLKRMHNDLVNMANWGWGFYDAVVGRFAGGEGAVKDFEEQLRQPGKIQIALKESPSYILPSALIYDYPIKLNAASYSICETFKSAYLNSLPLEDTSCFQGHCSSRGQLTTVCPSGFWGFRHLLGMPVSVKQSKDISPELTYKEKIGFLMGIATDLRLRDRHDAVIRNQSIELEEASTSDDVLTKMRDFKGQVVYFYCHGGLKKTMPYLRVGAKDGADTIFPPDLRTYNVSWEEPWRPLVFINGCHTTAVTPLQAHQFVSTLIQRSNGAGVIGTEITIFEELATDFALEFMWRFFTGQTTGEAVRGTRLKLLFEGNPLGLIYIPFVHAGLHLVKSKGQN